MDAAAGDMLAPEPRLMRYAPASFDCAAASAAKNTMQNRTLDTAFPFDWLESDEWELCG